MIELLIDFPATQMVGFPYRGSFPLFQYPVYQHYQQNSERGPVALRRRGLD